MGKHELHLFWIYYSYLCILSYSLNVIIIPFYSSTCSKMHDLQ